MDISVIVVTYNQEHTIARTLDSILAQRTAAAYEIVIGDDCSTDGTEAVCRRYAARFPDRITYLRREANMGVTRNYFDCIAHARGRYLADCAGDDFWVDPCKLQRQFEVLEADPGVSLVATDWLCCDPSGENPRRYPGVPAPEGTVSFPPGSITADILAQRMMIHLCTAMYRKSMLDPLVERHPDVFVNPAHTCEDQQILLAMSEAGAIVMLPEVTLHYSVGHESVSHRRSFASRFGYTLAATRQTRMMQRHFGVADSEMRGLYRRQTSHMAAMAFRSQDPALRRRLAEFIAETELRPGRKGRFYMFLSASPFIWKVSLAIASFLRRND